MRVGAQRNRCSAQLRRCGPATGVGSAAWLADSDLMRGIAIGPENINASGRPLGDNAAPITTRKSNRLVGMLSVPTASTGVSPIVAST